MAVCPTFADGLSLPLWKLIVQVPLMMPEQAALGALAAGLRQLPLPAAALGSRAHALPSPPPWARLNVASEVAAAPVPWQLLRDCMKS